jgi:glucokinase
MIIFSGDIGGTHTRMQLTEFSAMNKMKVLAKRHYQNESYACFFDIIDAFLLDTKINSKKIVSCCFGVAGPVINGKVNVTNLPWVITVADIKKKLKIDKIELINDFTAIGYGLKILKSKDLLTLQSGKPRKSGVKAYLGAGTGLGVGFVTTGNEVHSTEGGHVDFAPTDATQIKLLRYLHKQYQRVSVERILSGLGLTNIDCFVRDNNIAMRSLDIFIKVYGAAAGNLALTTLPYGGLYIVGGIAPKILPEFANGKFLEAFSDKGRMSNLLKDIPLHVVLNEDVGLQGAAICARKIMNSQLEESNASPA